MDTLKEKIIHLRNQGKTYNQISKELKCSKGTISYHIGAGQKEKADVRNKLNKEAYMHSFHEYKEKMGCFDCGKKFPHYVLEFDHKPEFKKIDNVYRVMKTYGIEKAWEEIAKCDVVCANCHKIRTYTRKPWGKQ